MRAIVFDTETTGFVRKNSSLSQQPYIIQRGSIELNIEPGMSAEDIEFVNPIDEMFRPTSNYIPKQCTDVHGISMDMVKNKDLIYAFLENMILGTFNDVDLIIAHNASFDMNMVFVEAKRIGKVFGKDLSRIVSSLKDKVFCTMKSSTDICKIGSNGSYKRPKLQELHKFCFGKMFDDAHNAFADVEATAKCFVDLIKKGHYTISDNNKVLIS